MCSVSFIFRSPIFNLIALCHSKNLDIWDSLQHELLEELKQGRDQNNSTSFPPCPRLHKHPTPGAPTEKNKDIFLYTPPQKKNYSIYQVSYS